VTNFLGFFQKVPLTMLLGTLFYSKMANFSHKNFTTSSSNNPQLYLLTQVVHYQTMTKYIKSVTPEEHWSQENFQV
jgi:hypothetical protein